MRPSQPSKTAIGIATAVLAGAHDDTCRRILPPESDAWSRRFLAEVSPYRKWEASRASMRSYQWLFRRLEGRGPMRGWRLHVALRKRFIDDVAQSAIAEGTRQVIVIGAGLDSLSARLAPVHRDVHFVEIDHPATQRVKRTAWSSTSLRDTSLRGTSQRGTSLGEAREPTFVECDLERDDFASVLSTIPRVDWAEPVLFILEGVLPYLSQSAVEQLLRAISRATTAGSRCVFSYLQRNPHDGALIVDRSGWIAFSVRWIGEPFRSGFAFDQLAVMLASMDYIELVTTPTQPLLKRYLGHVHSPLPTLDWEHLATVTRR